MRIGAFELQEPLPGLNEPHAFVLLRPWVDVGNAGSLTFSRLESSLQAQPLGRVANPGEFFDFTRYRPYIYFKEGRREVEVPNAFINYAKRKEGNDFLFFHLLEPHMFGEAYAEAILEVLKKLNVKRYCLIGGMYDVVPHTRPLIVTGNASKVETEQELRRIGVQPSRYEGPTTILILASQEAPNYDIETMSLIVHLPQYTQLEEDYNGELRILEFLCALYNLPIDIEQVKQKAEQQYNEVSRAVEKNPPIKQIVKQLEMHYESRIKKLEEVEEQPKLSPEIEKFLREIDKRFGQG